MDEPSVLDYLKAKLQPWRGPAPEIPPLGEKKPAPKVKKTKKTPVAPAKEEVAETPMDWANLPWRSPLAFVLLFFAQVLWQSPNSAWPSGVLVAFAALAVIIWAAQQGEWRVPAPEEGEREESQLVFQRWPLILSLFLFALAFISSAGNRFTPLNVFSWIGAVGFAMAAFLQSQPGPMFSWEKLKSKVPAREDLKLSRWHLLLLASFLLIAFFRFYRLGAVPLEMVSDHAEKLLDVRDILDGQASIFFPRNTGREPLQFYFAALLTSLLGTGLSFIILKLSTTLIGFVSLIYVYLLGKDMGGRWLGLMAMLLMGIAYWPNVLARTGLRFILYPAFVAPTLYYLLRGLRLGKINDYLLSGLFLGIGLYGYTAFRIVPLIALIALALFLLHKQAAGQPGKAVASFAVLVLVSLLVFTPLLRYVLEEDTFFNYRVLTRVGTLEVPLPGPAWQIFFSNIGDALAMLVRSAGDAWLVGLIRRPALDLITGTLFLLGAPLLLWRYLRHRNWQDLFWLISVPLLMLPSILSLAFPGENPALNRAGGAAIPVFLIAAYGLDSLLHGIKDRLGGRQGLRVAGIVGALLLAFIARQNYDLVFRQYAGEYALYSWNSSELGQEIREFVDSGAGKESAWVVSYPHWVDTRLVGINAGFAIRDFGIWPDQLENTLSAPAPKLFLLNLQDVEALQTLQMLYPQGVSSLLPSEVPGKEFLRYFVASEAE